MRVCAEPDCPEIQAESRCPTHVRERAQRRGSRSERGYGAEHARLRAAWAPEVEAGRVDCHAERCLEPSRRIAPGAAWDLGHTPDRTAWTGPEHARCNRSDGGRRAHETTAARRATPPPRTRGDVLRPPIPRGGIPKTRQC